MSEEPPPGPAGPPAPSQPPPLPDDPLASTTDPGGLARSPPASLGLLRTLAWLRRFAKVWGFAAFCIAIVYVFRDVALPFLFAVLVAYILAPLVDRMAAPRIGSRRMPRGLAVVVLYIGILGMLGLGIGYFIPKLSGDFARLFREAPHLIGKVKEDWGPRVGAWVDTHFGAGHNEAAADPRPSEPQRREILVAPLPDGRYRIDLDGLALEVQPAPSGSGKYLIGPPAPLVTDDAADEGKWERAIKKSIADMVTSTEGQTLRALEWGQKFVTAVVTGFARLVLVLMVAAFILIDLERIRGFLRSLIPEPYRLDYDRIAKGIDRGLSGVIRGQLIICLINGLLTYVGLWLFQVKYSLLLGLIAAVMSLVPIFGSILSSVPIVAIALASSGTLDLRKALFVLAWIVAIHLLEANVLNPKIMGGAAKIHPVLVVFALIAGEHTYGFVGALFAVPMASIIQTIFVYYRRRQFSRAGSA